MYWEVREVRRAARAARVVVEECCVVLGSRVVRRERAEDVVEERVVSA